MAPAGLVKDRVFSQKQRFIVQEWCWVVHPCGLALYESGQWRVLDESTSVTKVTPVGEGRAVTQSTRVWRADGRVFDAKFFSNIVGAALAFGHDDSPPLRPR
jgi:hypothetical protein